jgi:lipoprotein-anchoring transpeptidase ErfK/SrfK
MLRMRFHRFPTLLLIFVVVALFVACMTSAQAEPQGSAEPDSANTSASDASGKQEDQVGAKPASGPHAVQPGQQSTLGESKSGQTESGAANQKPTLKIVINIDKSQQEMTVFVDGVEQYRWPISTGRRGYSTPSGTYTPTSMNEVWYSKQWDNAPMPHAIFFMKDGHAIHGSYEIKTLGKPVSHGCVRIAPDNATKLFTLVKETGLQNTQVVLTGTTPGGEAKVASDRQAYPRYGEADQWYGPRREYELGYYPPLRRRGFFGRLFGGPGPYPSQGYYRPRGYYPPGY